MGSKIAEHLKAVRGDLGMTLREVAAETGVAHSTLSRLENGENSPVIETQAKLVRWMGLDPDEADSGAEAVNNYWGQEIMRASREAERRKTNQLLAEILGVLKEIQAGGSVRG